MVGPVGPLSQPLHTWVGRQQRGQKLLCSLAQCCHGAQNNSVPRGEGLLGPVSTGKFKPDLKREQQPHHQLGDVDNEL